MTVLDKLIRPSIVIYSIKVNVIKARKREHRANFFEQCLVSLASLGRGALSLKCLLNIIVSCS